MLLTVNFRRKHTMDTIGDALNPVYINDRGVPKKIAEGNDALKSKLAIGMDANGALKTTDLATSSSTYSTSYDDTKIATKGYLVYIRKAA